MMVGNKIELGQGTNWHGFYELLEIVKIFKNGKMSVKVNFNGKIKVFNI